jgi:predicted RNase H-like HicB family nuclease
MLKTQQTAYTNIRGDIMPVIFNVFNVIIRPAEDVGGYYAVCDMPNGGCTAQADTIQEIQKDMLEAIDFFLEDHPEITNYYVEFEVQDAKNSDC